MSELFGSADIDLLEINITTWLKSIGERFDEIVAVDQGEPGEHRWYVRMRGEEKEFTTVWFHLGQRTLKYETYVMPAPEENAQELYENVLRRNESLVGAHFSIGIEDAIFLRGELPIRLIDEQELDRIIGTLYAYVEQIFPSIIRIGFRSRFNQ
jgi:Putative bacterial sensory transduction regulator